MPIVVKTLVDDKGTHHIIELGKLANNANKQMLTTGKLMSAVFGGSVLMRAFDGIRARIMETTEEVKKYQHSVKGIEAVTGVSGKALGTLDKMFRNYAKATEFSASALAEAGSKVIRMGASVEQTKRILPDAMNMATAAGEDLVWSATNMMNVMKMFGLETTESTRVANVMATVLNKTSLELEDYMEGMKFVGPIGRAMNFTLEETSSLLGILGDAALRGTVGGTALKNTLLKLLTPTSATAAALRNFNKENASLADILAHMRQEGMGAKEFLEQFDLRALTGALNLSKMSVATNQLTKDLVSQSVTAKSVADKQRESWQVMSDRLVNNFNAVALSFASTLGDGPNSVMARVIGMLDRLDQWTQKNAESIQQNIGKIFDAFVNIGKAAKVTTPLLEVLAKNIDVIILAFTAKGLLGGVTKVGGAFNKATGGVAGFSGAIKALNGVVNAFPLTKLAILATTLGTMAINTQFDNFNKELDARGARLNNYMSLETVEKMDAVLNSLKSFVTKYPQEGRNLAGLSQTYAGSRFNYGAGQKEDAAKDTLGAFKVLTDEFPGMFASIGGMSPREAMEYLTGIRNKVQLAATNKRGPIKFTEGLTITGGKSPGGDLPGAAEGAKEDTTVPWQTIIDKAVAYYVENNNGFDWNNEWPTKEDKNKDFEARRRAGKAEELAFEDKIAQEIADEEAEKIRKRKQDIIDSVGYAENMSTNLASVFYNIYGRQTEIMEEEFAKQDSILQEKYDKELRLVGDSEFKKRMLELKFDRLRDELAKKQEAKAKEMRKKQLRAQLGETLANTAYAGIKILAAPEPIPVFAKWGMFISAMAAGASAADTIMSEMSRAREGAIVGGEGNSTSDSSIWRLSKGERVLSTNEVDALGGHNAITRAIDQSVNYSTQSSVTVVIQSFVGTKEYAQSIIPMIKKELAR